MDLTGKVAIVTGGARDIGKEVTLKLAGAGASVAFNYYGSADEARATEAQVKAMGGNVLAMQGDMTRQEDVDALVASALSEFGGSIDILVNVSGGLIARKTLAEMDVDFFKTVIDLNLTSTFLTTQACVPHMASGSAIVNLASQAGRDGGGPGASAYASGKGAVMTFTRAMAKELGPQNIRVNALCPGMISTTFHDTFSKDEVRKNVANATPLRREGNPAEIADAVLYLASDASSFITGVKIDTNGGLFFS
jgi:3-oxoacyl-[acyl-carrier protein] reductase